MSLPSPTPRGITVLERGWLSSNNVLLHGDGRGAVLIDSSHVVHAEQTVALVRHALRGEPLARIVNTHLHSDHCGGNAALQRAFGARIAIPPGQWDAARRWDTVALTHGPTQQLCERFVPGEMLSPGDTLDIGGRRWQALAAPGHDPHSLILFDAQDGVLVSADALWEHGFGVVFPELEGESGFAEAGAVLELIASLPVRLVVPGHGAPFTDVAAALARARERLAGQQADPARHARHAIKVLLKYHLMEQRRETLADFHRWLADATLAATVWQRLGRPDGALTAWGERLAAELVAGGALRREGDALVDATIER